jgi:23S rRNA pseudouridine2604 synthase
MPEAKNPSNQDSISLNKFISSTGLCSRRQADKWIEEGRVQINKQPAKKGNRVFPSDQVTIDGKPLRNKPQAIYLMYHKPLGVTCTTDRRDKSNIIDRIRINQRIFPIGRLDKNSTGLILLTNDGDIVNKILRKENRNEKEYVVGIDAPITSAFLKKMSGPIPILGTKTLPAQVTQIKPHLFKIILTQGLNRQIRRMVEYCGHKVMSLKRIRIMDIHLGDLKLGEWRYLTEEELKSLQKGLK